MDYADTDGRARGGEAVEGPGGRYRRTPRSEEELRQLRHRLNRMAGQLNGIGRMLDENRYCGDILIQVGAVEQALKNFGYQLLKSHLETCVTEEIRAGNAGIMEETLELVKRMG